jgi:hypothetical protein
MVSRDPAFCTFGVAGRQHFGVKPVQSQANCRMEVRNRFDGVKRKPARSASGQPFRLHLDNGYAAAHRWLTGGGAHRASRVTASELAVGPHGTQGCCTRVGRRAQDALLGARAEGDSCLSATLTRVTSWSSGVDGTEGVAGFGPSQVAGAGVFGLAYHIWKTERFETG